MSRRGDFDAFAVAAPGLEPVVAQELHRLGVTEPAVVEGGVAFLATRQAIHAANLHLRTASRVLVRLASFPATSFAELERNARRVPWDRVLGPGTPVRLRVTCRKSRLYHSDAVAQRLLRDLTDRAGALSGGDGRGSVEDDPGPGQLFIVRLDRNRCTVSADSSGAHLHLRGYRTAVTAAPVRETLAAALILSSGWDRRSPLLDPFCGSGTIPIEAAMMAAGMAPGRNRSFRFMDWPGFDRAGWERLREAALDKERRDARCPVTGSDRSTAAIAAAADNAARAGVAELLRLERRDALEMTPPPGPAGWIVSNPPYGVRLGDRSALRRVQAGFGAVLRQRFGGWRLTLLAADAGTGAGLGISLREELQTTNGGITVRVLSGTIGDGGPEAPPDAGRRDPRRRM